MASLPIYFTSANMFLLCEVSIVRLRSDGEESVLNSGGFVIFGKYEKNKNHPVVVFYKQKISLSPSPSKEGLLLVY